MNTDYDMIVCSSCTYLLFVHVQEAGRLLYAHQDDWVHINCALWSAEVFEEIDGTLQHVNIAVKRGKMLVG